MVINTRNTLHSHSRLNVVYLSAVAPLAQLAEQSPFKSWVVGSSPTGGTFLYPNLDLCFNALLNKTVIILKINLPKRLRLDHLRQD